MARRRQSRLESTCCTCMCSDRDRGTHVQMCPRHARSAAQSETLSESAPRDTRGLAKFLAASPRAGLGASAHFLQQNPSLPMEHEPMELHSVSQSIDFGGMFNDALFNDASIVDGHERAGTREEDLDQG